MKKFISAILFSFVIVLLSCGSGDTADVGVRITTKVPAHGHNSSIDGGVLKLAVTNITNSQDFVVTAGTSTTLTFDTESLDSLSTHSTVTNPSRITIPAGYNYASITFVMSGYHLSPPTFADMVFSIRKNGIGIYTPSFGLSTAAYLSLVSFPNYIASVTEGDYLEFDIVNNNAAASDATITVQYVSIVLYR